jgi:hypothetical protein
MVKAVVNKYPQLLNERDRGEGALFFAVERKLEWFIEAVLESKIKDQDLERALGPAKSARGGHFGSQTNCLHKAISKGLEPSLLVKLIRKVKNLLAAQDGSGLTPLHHAVEYQRCTERRICSVRELLDCGGEALDKRTTPPDAFSVYRWHQETRRQHHAKAKLKALEPRTDRKPNWQCPPERPTPRPDEDLRPEIDDKMPKERKGKESENSIGPWPLKRVPTLKQQAALCVDTTYVPTRANEGRSLFEGSPKVQAPPASISAAPQPSAKLTTRRKKKSRNVSDDVANLLKLHYFRSVLKRTPEGRTPASAEDFLFGDNAECKTIYFDFPPQPRRELEKIDFEQFQNSYQAFEFDPILLHVRFRKLELESRNDDRAVQKRRQEGPGKRDLVRFFDWLRKEKGVRNILKVTVEEGDDGFHSDEGIEKSLRGFEGIEILDWRKPDICPVAVRRAVRKEGNNSAGLLELHLRWTGNNAVLRAWSARGGLAALPILEKVHVYEIEVN